MSSETFRGGGILSKIEKVFGRKARALSTLALLATFDAIDPMPASAALTKDPIHADNSVGSGSLTGPHHEMHVLSPRQRLFRAFMAVQQLRMQCASPDSDLDQQAASRLASLDATSIDAYSVAYERALQMTTFVEESDKRFDDKAYDDTAATLEEFAKLLSADIQTCKDFSAQH